MKLKLIRSGGFMHKTVTTEEDLGSYPAFVQDRIAQAFYSTIEESKDTKEVKQNDRDSFQYFAEYNGKLLPLDVLENDSLLGDFIRKLKERLRF